MKKLLLFPLMLCSHLLFAGGFSGGGPPPKSSEELMLSAIPDLNIFKEEISQDDYRRVKMRLSVADFTTLAVADRVIDLTSTKGAVTNLSADIQFVPRLQITNTAE